MSSEARQESFLTGKDEAQIIERFSALVCSGSSSSFRGKSRKVERKKRGATERRSLVHQFRFEKRRKSTRRCKKEKGEREERGEERNEYVEVEDDCEREIFARGNPKTFCARREMAAPGVRPDGIRAKSPWKGG